MPTAPEQRGGLLVATFTVVGAGALAWFLRTRRQPAGPAAKGASNAALLKSTKKTANGAIELYDQWAKEYDQNLLNWGYDAHVQCAKLWRDYSPTGSLTFSRAHVLDCGCGTGLSGETLKKAGAKSIVGIDISQVSLDLCEDKHVYNETRAANIEGPLPYPDNAFAGVVCVGVTSYITNNKGLLSEWCRTTCPLGCVVFTITSDKWHRDLNGIRTAAQGLVKAGRWSLLHMSRPAPYMPTNPDPELRRMKIYYLVYRVH